MAVVELSLFRPLTPSLHRRTADLPFSLDFVSPSRRRGFILRSGGSLAASSDQGCPSSTTSLGVSSQSISLRRASEDDMVLIKRLIWAEKMMPIDLPKERFLVADGGPGIGLVGAGQLKEWGGDPTLREIRSMIVRPDFRGRGVGSRILRELLARQSGNKSIYLVTVRSRMNFYRRAGFVEVTGEDVPPQLRLEISVGSVIANLVNSDTCVCMRVEV